MDLENGLQVVFCFWFMALKLTIFILAGILQSKYSARSAYYSRITIINREYLNHPTVEMIRELQLCELQTTYNNSGINFLDIFS